jgi:hypothetical protein
LAAGFVTLLQGFIPFALGLIALLRQLGDQTGGCGQSLFGLVTFLADSVAFLPGFIPFALGRVGCGQAAEGLDLKVLVVPALGLR